eukprot:1140317-Pelagomonas_calceolata.AAC.2
MRIFGKLRKTLSQEAAQGWWNVPRDRPEVPRAEVSHILPAMADTTFISWHGWVDSGARCSGSAG